MELIGEVLINRNAQFNVSTLNSGTTSFNFGLRPYFYFIAKYSLSLGNEVIAT